MRISILLLCSVLCSAAYSLEPLLPNQDQDPGVVMFESADYVEAERYFMAHMSKQDPLYELSLLYLAKLSVLRNHGSDAVRYIEQSLAIEPNLVEEQLLAGDAYCAKARQVTIFSALKLGRSCGAQYTDAANRHPKNTKALRTAIQFHIAAPSLAGGSIKSAEEYLNQLTRLSEEDARILQVKLTEKDGSDKKAIAMAQKYSSLPYSNPSNLYDLAIFFKEKKIDEKALEIFNRIMAENAEKTGNWHVTDTLFQVGEMHIIAGENTDEGVMLIEQYISINKNVYDQHYFWSRWRLAAGYKRMGNESKYSEMVALIKSGDYTGHSDFKKEFESRIY